MRSGTDAMAASDAAAPTFSLLCVDALGTSCSRSTDVRVMSWFGMGCVGHQTNFKLFGLLGVAWAGVD